MYIPIWGIIFGIMLFEYINQAGMSTDLEQSEYEDVEKEDKGIFERMINKLLG